jgi:hypothetical protein
VFLTADQNLAQSALRIIVLVAPSNKLEDLLPLVPTVLRLLSRLAPGELQRMSR